MLIEIDDIIAEQITKETLIDMLHAIDDDLASMDLEDIISMGRARDAILGTLKYICSAKEFERLFSQS